MTQTVYLKLSQITQVHEKNVPLASLGEVYCSEKSVENRRASAKICAETAKKEGKAQGQVTLPLCF